MLRLCLRPSSMHFIPYVLQLILRTKLFSLQGAQGDIVYRKPADDGFMHLVVEFLMLLVEPTEIRVGSHQGFDFFTLLVFKHDPTSSRQDCRRVTGAPMNGKKHARARTRTDMAETGD
jgi:hypothetical protein